MTTLTTLDRQILTRTRELILDPKHWTRGTYALSAYGEDVEPTDARATCWCVRGAYRKATRELLDKDARAVEAFAAWDQLYEFTRARHPFGPIDVNDHLGHDAIIGTLNALLETAQVADLAERGKETS